MSDLSILETSIIEPLDPAFVKKTLSQPPFYQIQGLINTRSIPLPEPTSGTTKQRGLILRGAETNHITTLGKNQLAQQLGVTTIFDLRSDKERAKFGPDPLDIPGVEIVCVPAMSASQTDDLKATFGGKDRTGVAAMLILDLIGVSDEEIIKDYALTRVGGEPMREMMVKRFAPLLQDPEVGEASINALSCRPSVMRATLDMLREEYGGAAGYLKDRLGFSAEDVAKIIENLTSKEK
ncbi:hypothetical protein FRC04_001790 [Tulasnella sp. 424]|nr:hypothetical protein FRC04_001790 [Tulasnella sp. 424]KAG8968183.1 hypothetical protein FRC05_001660 [Tulasnella sp. 425]